MRRTILLLMLPLWALLSCTKSEEMPECTSHAVYYWRTTFKLSPQQRQWLEEEHVERIYLHLFDVVYSEGFPCNVRPEATLQFRDSVPEGIEVVPVVFMAPDVMGHVSDVHQLTHLLLGRMDDMMRLNGLSTAHEVQLDFDWTLSNQAHYFDLLQTLADTLHADKRELSVTIRLHQLRQDAPPVDRGVLMLYNTGNFRDPDEPNSILTRESVEPYMPFLADYSLPMDFGMPAFSWNLVFRRDAFACIAPGLDLHDTLLFHRLDSTHWRSVCYQPIPFVGVSMAPNQRIYPGDVIRREESSPQLNQFLFEHLTRERPSLARRVVLYHLDADSMQHFPTLKTNHKHK